jgi:hypothetical protein
MIICTCVRTYACWASLARLFQLGRDVRLFCNDVDMLALLLPVSNFIHVQLNLMKKCLLIESTYSLLTIVQV